MDISNLTSAMTLLALLAAVLAVDDRAGWQSLLAEPVCMAVVIGALTHQYEAALITGTALQFVWISILPMRGTRRPDTVVGGVVGIGATCLLLRHTADPRVVYLAACGVCGGLLVGELSGFAARQANRLRNAWLGSFRPTGADAVTSLRLIFYHFLAVGSVALVAFVLVTLFLPAALIGIEWVTRRFSGVVAMGAQWWLSLLPALAVAALVQLYWHRNLNRFLLVSAGIFLVVLWAR